MNRSTCLLPILGLTGILAVATLAAQDAQSAPQPRFLWGPGVTNLAPAAARGDFAGSPFFGSAPVERPSVNVAFELDGHAVTAELGTDEVRIEVDGKPIDAARVEAVTIPGISIVHTHRIRDAEGQPAVDIGTSGGSVTVRFLPRSKKAWLGVDVRPLGDALAGHLDLDAEAHALVVAVRPDSPAARAGLLQHDVLVAIDGEGPVTHERLGGELAAKKPGEILKLGVVRRGERLEVDVELGRAPVDQLAPFSGVRFYDGLQNDVLARPGAADSRMWLDAEGRLLKEQFPAFPGQAQADGDADPFTPRVPGARRAAGEDEGLSTRIERIESTLLQLEKLLERLEKGKKGA